MGGNDRGIRPNLGCEEVFIEEVMFELNFEGEVEIDCMENRMKGF